jgi:hypothetical protein
VEKIEHLTDRIAKLNPAKQVIVERFIEKLESSPSHSQMTLDQVIDEFEHEHPELLHLLAQ